MGVGTDVVDIERFMAQLARTPGLRLRLFTPEERDLPPASLAARFAAKEAIAKSLGAPVGLRWHDCTVTREVDGAPTVRATGSVAARMDALGVARLHLSLSHDAGIASATCIAEADPGLPG